MNITVTPAPRMGLRARARRGFTLMEIMVAAAIAGIGTVVALPQLRGIVETAKLTGNASQARALVTAVNLYRMKSGNAITGTATDPMTVTRANQIYAQVATYTANGEAIVESNFALSANATFPTGWGEIAAGSFDPIP